MLGLLSVVRLSSGPVDRWQFFSVDLVDSSLITNFLPLQFVQELFFAYRIPSTNHWTDFDEIWCVTTSRQIPGINRSTFLIFDP